MAPSERTRSVPTMLEPDTALDAHVRVSSDACASSDKPPPLYAHRDEPVERVPVCLISHGQATLAITPGLDPLNQLASTGTVRITIAYGQQSVTTADFGDSCGVLGSQPLRVVGVT
jgi:hypothetical protein